MTMNDPQMPNFTAVCNAFREMESFMQRLDSNAGTIAEMLVGRLRRANNFSALAKLKRELRDFNIQTHRWKE